MGYLVERLLHCMCGICVVGGRESCGVYHGMEWKKMVLVDGANLGIGGGSTVEAIVGKSFPWHYDDYAGFPSSERQCSFCV